MSEMLKTMLNRIEHNKNALKTKRYYVEDLISNEELIILVEEIERLKEEINNLKFTPKTRFKDVIELREENKRLKSIIKEVREYITNNLCDNKARVKENISGKDIDDLLEILDKENKND